jgi:hypothetical protein
MTIKLIRVRYGKKSTPPELREYVMEGTNGPVGTIEEWMNSGLQFEVLEEPKDL